MGTREVSTTAETVTVGYEKGEAPVEWMFVITKQAPAGNEGVDEEPHNHGRQSQQGVQECDHPSFGTKLVKGDQEPGRYAEETGNQGRA